MLSITKGGYSAEFSKRCKQTQQSAQAHGKQCLTDRETYIKYLEGQVQQVENASTTMHAFLGQLDDTTSKMRALEDKVLMLAKLLQQSQTQQDGSDAEHREALEQLTQQLCSWEERARQQQQLLDAQGPAVASAIAALELQFRDTLEHLQSLLQREVQGTTASIDSLHARVSACEVQIGEQQGRQDRAVAAQDRRIDMLLRRHQQELTSVMQHADHELRLLLQDRATTIEVEAQKAAATTATVMRQEMAAQMQALQREARREREERDGVAAKRLSALQQEVAQLQVLCNGLQHDVTAATTAAKQQATAQEQRTHDGQQQLGHMERKMHELQLQLQRAAAGTQQQTATLLDEVVTQLAQLKQQQVAAAEREQAAEQRMRQHATAAAECSAAQLREAVAAALMPVTRQLQGQQDQLAQQLQHQAHASQAVAATFSQQLHTAEQGWQAVAASQTRYLQDQLDDLRQQMQRHGQPQHALPRRLDRNIEQQQLQRHEEEHVHRSPQTQQQQQQQRQQQDDNGPDPSSPPAASPLAAASPRQLHPSNVDSLPLPTVVPPVNLLADLMRRLRADATVATVAPAPSIFSVAPNVTTADGGSRPSAIAAGAAATAAVAQPSTGQELRRLPGHGSASNEQRTAAADGDTHSPAAPVLLQSPTHAGERVSRTDVHLARDGSASEASPRDTEPAAETSGHSARQLPISGRSLRQLPKPALGKCEAVALGQATPSGGSSSGGLHSELSSESVAAAAMLGLPRKWQHAIRNGLQGDAAAAVAAAAPAAASGTQTRDSSGAGTAFAGVGSRLLGRSSSNSGVAHHRRSGAAAVRSVGIPGDWQDGAANTEAVAKPARHSTRNAAGAVEQPAVARVPLSASEVHDMLEMLDQIE